MLFHPDLHFGGTIDRISGNPSRDCCQVLKNGGASVAIPVEIGLSSPIASSSSALVEQLPLKLITWFNPAKATELGAAFWYAGFAGNGGRTTAFFS